MHGQFWSSSSFPVWIKSQTVAQYNTIPKDFQGLGTIITTTKATREEEKSSNTRIAKEETKGMSLTKPFSGKPGENDSNGSNGGGSGNNSDNSAFISLGNTSFGFNFDSEDGGLNNSRSNFNNSEEGDSDGSNQASEGKSKVQSSIKVETTKVPLVESSKRDIASKSSPPNDAANVPLTVQTEAKKTATPSNTGNGRFIR